jgi:hypothetical protein
VLRIHVIRKDETGVGLSFLPETRRLCSGDNNILVDRSFTDPAVFD